MKRFLSALLLLLSVGTSSVAQYPKDETVTPYPKPIKEAKLVQRFQGDADAFPRWKALHQTTILSRENRLVVESSGTDPYILLPAIEKPQSGAFEIRIRMKNDMKPRAEFFWATEKTPHFTGEHAVRFGFFQDASRRENRRETYRVRFATDAPLTRLRFDPGTSEGVCEIDGIELYSLEFDESEQRPTEWFAPDWAAHVASWKTIASDHVKIEFDEKGTGARVFLDAKHVGDVYPLAHFNADLPLGGIADIPVVAEEQHSIATGLSNPCRLKLLETNGNRIAFSVGPEVESPPFAHLRFALKNDELRFEWKGIDTQNPVAAFGPVFRPRGTMRQALLCGVEYLEQGEHSSSTADLETAEHLRHAPKPMDVTWPFMSIITDAAGFGLLWDDPETQSVFATPDIIFGDSQGHYMGLHGSDFAGTLKIALPKNREHRAPESFTELEEMILWAVQRFGVPELPKRPRDDEAQRLLNLAAFEKSLAAGPTGWQHAATPGSEKQFFPMNYGNDFVSAIWQLSGRLPEVPRLDHGGGHLRNPASFFLMQKANEFLGWTRNESRHLRNQQQDDGSFRYAGVYLKGHWDDTASGHCGNALYRLMYNYRILGDRETLDAALKGLEFANRFPTPRGAQVWEISLHTPDIMGSSRMCMANVWAFEATGERKYLDAARRWAVTGLPFVYFWTSKSIETVPGGSPESIMRYATIPVLGATNWQAPNWIGLPVQWCGLDYGEALFMLARHDKTLDWQKIAEGILIAAEQMQYPDGICVGLLPDSLTLETQSRNPHDINPSVLVMQRRRLQGKIDGVDVALGPNGTYRVVSPYKTTIETSADGKSVAVIEAEKGTTYQILVNGSRIETIHSQGTDRLQD